ncbi:MAG: LamG-like jellyroll fold domain-containing protein [Chthoniobacteraceae bacterium]
MTRWLVPLGALLALAAGLRAHPLTFNSTITYSSTEPAGGAASVANWTGAAFDAANIGGSGVNADGGADNGAANDESTYVAGDRPRQGQAITTGSNANGYDLTSVTVRMAGYTNNTATGANSTAWNLNASFGPIMVEIGRITGTSYAVQCTQNFIAGGTGNPGAGQTANGTGTYVTFNLPFAVHLEPNTTYGFDLRIGNGSGTYFEWLGTSTDPYSGGTAYTREWWGGPITTLSGDRVFLANMTASAAPYAPFSHPGTLHTQTDLTRMAAKVAANAQPWKSDYDILAASPYAQTWWGPYNVDYINRGGANPNNYTRSQQDAQAIYELALRWHITGDAAYADRAVLIANVWSDLLGVTGDTNGSLAAGICGYLFAIGGDLLSTYPGWPMADKQAYKDMMMRVFYPANFDFLWRHHGTPISKGGNTHYRLNWDTFNMASMAAIGVFCDNRAVYEQAIDYFKYGPGNGRIERAAWMIHPNGLGQGEEAGRDQPHSITGWMAMALLCQIAWSQGDDLYGYDNNRALRAFEYNAKYNLGYDVPYTRHRNASLSYTEGAIAPRSGFIPIYEQIYNHYVNIKGLAAPYSKLVAELLRPEDRPHTEYHPSQVDWFGLGTLTFTLDPIATGAVPGGLVGNWSTNKITLNWWGSAYATSYNVKRATTSGGPYTTIGTARELDTTFTDPNVANGATYYYVVSAEAPGGETANSAELAVTQSLVTRYTFENTLDDIVGTRHGAAMGGSTGGPGFAVGQSGQAVSLDGVDDFVQLPVGSGNYQDITIAVWVYWNGGGAWQRVFDFGSEIEKYMFVTPKSGSNTLRFQITTTRNNDDSVTLDGPAMPTATWTHVAVTLNGDTATLYVNGVPVDADTATVDPLFGQTFCYLGKSMWNGDPLFSGRIDDFRIYNHALSGSDVYAVWGQSANNAPTFTSDPMVKQNATEDVAYSQTIAGSATDANGGTLTYLKVGGPPWLSVASTGALTGTPANANVGENLFVVRVTDPSGATDDANLYIAVGNVNDAPTWNASPIAKPAVTRDQPYAFALATLAGDASDVDAGDTLTFSKVSGPAWLAVAASGALTGTPAVGDVGANVFTVRVTDGTSAFADATLNITVLGFGLRTHLLFENNVADALGNANGNAAGSPAYIPGRTAQSIVLDGADDVVTLPDGAASYQDITIAAFVFWNGGALHQRIFDFGNGTSQYLELTSNAGSGMRLEMINGGFVQQINATVMPSGRWVHVAFTLSGDTGTLYVDGAVVATNTAMTINPDDFRPSVNFIGDSQWVNDPLLNGRLDDFRIYNYALSGAEITALLDIAPAPPSGVVGAPRSSRIDLSWIASQGAQTYSVKRSLTSGTGYAPVANGLASPSLSDSPLTNGTTYFYIVTATNTHGESNPSDEISAVPSELLVHLKFDETNGTNAVDATGNGWDATLGGAAAFVAGQIGNAVTLGGVNADSVTMQNGIVSTLDDFTITAWVNPTTFATWARIFDFGTDTTNYMFLTTQRAGTTGQPRFAFRVANAAEQGVDSSIALTAGTWNHVAVSLSGNTLTLYVNGAVAGTNTSVTNRPSQLGVTTMNWLGDSQWGADPSLNGVIDDFRIYTRTLTAGEITTFQTLLTAPQNLAATPGPQEIALAWDPVANASTYLVKTSASSGGPYSALATLAGTNFTHTGLPMAARYYVVAAQNFTGTGADSSEAGATAESPAFSAVELRGGTLAFTSGGTAMTFTMPASVVGHTYQLQYCADLTAGQWDEIGAPESGTGNNIVFSIPFAPGTQGFFRLLITQ